MVAGTQVLQVPVLVPPAVTAHLAVDPVGRLHLIVETICQVVEARLGRFVRLSLFEYD